MHEAVAAYGRWLEETPLPKLLLHARPGGIIDANLTIVDIGPGIHYAQEDNPHAIGEAIAAWWDRL